MLTCFPSHFIDSQFPYDSTPAPSNITWYHNPLATTPYHQPTNPTPLPIFLTSAFFKYHSLANPRINLAKTGGFSLPLSTALPRTKMASPRARSSATASYSWFPTTVVATSRSSMLGSGRPRFCSTTRSASRTDCCRICVLLDRSADRGDRDARSDCRFCRAVCIALFCVVRLPRSCAFCCAARCRSPCSVAPSWWRRRSFSGFGGMGGGGALEGEGSESVRGSSIMSGGGGGLGLGWEGGCCWCWN